MLRNSQPTRREVLTWGAAALAAGTCLNHLAAEEKGTADIDFLDAIDAHVHVWTSDIKSYPPAAGVDPQTMQPAHFTPEDLFQHTRPAGVDRIVLIQMSYYKNDNRYMLDTLAKSPEVFRAVAQIDEDRTDLRDAILKHVGDGVRGYRLWTTAESIARWDSSAGMQNMWKIGAETNMKMCLLANPDTLPAIFRWCRKYPETPVVIDHMARIGMTGTIRQSDVENLCRLSECGNVYVKTSAFYALGAKKPPYTDLGPLIRKLRDSFGASRLMWASDCPFQVEQGHSYAASINLIKSGLDFLSKSDRRWMLRDTAEKVFFS